MAVSTISVLALLILSIVAGCFLYRRRKFQRSLMAEHENSDFRKSIGHHHSEDEDEWNLFSHAPMPRRGGKQVYAAVPKSLHYTVRSRGSCDLDRYALSQNRASGEEQASDTVRRSRRANPSYTTCHDGPTAKINTPTPNAPTNSSTTSIPLMRMKSVASTVASEYSTESMARSQSVSSRKHRADRLLGHLP
ncbi:hypothetical protein C8R43DRAFT_962221 [Mycena crocata]|nr:hypothetical protein C8R43DRAFT_962221 [Mycena crocata]